MSNVSLDRQEVDFGTTQVGQRPSSSTLLVHNHGAGEAYETERYLNHTRNPFKHPAYLRALVEYWEQHERLQAQEHTESRY